MNERTDAEVLSTEDIRNAFIDHGSFVGSEDNIKAFDAWLIQHDREIKAEAWDEGYATGYRQGQDRPFDSYPGNPYEGA